MASKIEICNQALAKVGASFINDLQERTQESQYCNLFYDQVVEEVISEGAWSTAVFRRKLIGNPAAPSFGYAYSYHLPTDPKIIRILELNITGDHSYAIEGGQLLTDMSEVDIRFIGKLEDPRHYGTYLTRAIISRLAQELCFPMNKDKARLQTLTQEHLRDLETGLTEDGMQGSSIDIMTQQDITL